MSTLAVLALATPIFGFALTPPSGGLSPNAGAFPTVSTQLDDDATPDEDIDEGVSDEAVSGGVSNEDSGDSATDDRFSEDLVEGEAAEPASVPTAEETASSAPDMEAYAAQMRQRADVMPIHRAFGIATWVSMLATVVLGTIQYGNLYGFFGGVEDTPCVQGGAVFGQEQCYGVAWPHRVSSILTSALYTTTFVLSFTMPDPDGLDQGDGAYARNLSLHKTLRWMHMAGMFAQIVLGLFTANAQEWFGLDRANNFGELQAMATAHQVIGLTTFGVLTASGAMMIF